MIRVENISVLHNKGEPTETIALNKLSLHVYKGDFIVIIGHNGSGKSTLLNALAGNVRLSSGHIYIEGNNVTAWKDHERAVFISRVFQNPAQGTASSLSILENLRLSAIRTKNKRFVIGTDKKFESFIKDKLSILKMGLENNVHKPAGSLSGGQRQALTLLMTTIDDRKLLLLDEPTAALEPKSSGIIMTLADELIRREKLTALLVTHNLKDAIAYGNRLIVMSEGKVVKDYDAAAKSKLTMEELLEWFG